MRRRFSSFPYFFRVFRVFRGLSFFGPTQNLRVAQRFSTLVVRMKHGIVTDLRSIDCRSRAIVRELFEKKSRAQRR